MIRDHPTRWLPLLLLSAMLYGQSFNASAGGSQIYNAYGLKTDYKWRNASGWSGVGYNDGGVRVGGYLQMPLTGKSLSAGESAGGYHVGIGDQMLSGFLDVDEYDTHAFTVRGINFIHKTKADSLEVFSGFLSQETNLPYLRVSSVSGGQLQQTPLGAVIYRHKFSDTLQFHSLNMMSSKLTSIQSLGWRPSRTWKFAGAVGIGSGAGYLGGSGEFHQKVLDLRTSYTISGSSFQRQEGLYYSTEPDGLNARLSITPIPTMKFILDHERNRTSVTGLPSVTSTYDSASISASFKGFQFSPTVSTVSTNNLPGRTNTEMFSISRRILPRWRAFGAYIHMESPTFKQQTYVATNEFKINSRLAIRQNFNRINGQNSFSAGGHWMSNRVSFTVDRQVYMSPLAAAFGGKSVFQAWTFGVRFRSFHGTRADINSFIDPNGKMQWGGYLAGLRYDAVAPYRSTSPNFFKYIVRGVVVDETGKGVWGIAVQIGTEVVLSDEKGEFYLNVKNTKPMPLTVVKESSIQTSRWSLNSSPTVAQGRLEAAPSDPLQITVSTRQVRASM